MKSIRDISNKLSERFEVSKIDSIIFTEAVFEEVYNILIEDREEVRIKNFGTFYFGKVAGRKTKHPVTKKHIIIDESTTIRFKQATKLKNAVHLGDE